MATVTCNFWYCNTWQMNVAGIILVVTIVTAIWLYNRKH